MIVSNYEHGYYDEFGRTHVQYKTENGWGTFSTDLLIKIRELRGIEIGRSDEVPNHPYVGKSFIDKDGKKKTILRVYKSYNFGVEYGATYEDEHGSGSTFTLQRYGNSIFKMYGQERDNFIENQLIGE